ncbi:phospholipid/cholesterol/gamma-HCH transport system substrate-binding protein [Parabacteroides sp. PF5-5]|uniref:MlaD family protein n=1 Tax=unclassified Parabacteroides TaxID=2649774 RepID=UPI002473DE85|nr:MULTISPECIES: MlaD family protein [unclassified Parabacteroides]MDH6304528.1 phospholipid/cholesterol/gamma-HCH transport system substrate-binding protein [Parabacteroides sp. PH5-39]MDH6315320.1 phospholipid/cholesterol/gamma-HCH transport system substrate-binding protein [Parabacteroides sp. PF5-13]MDH6319186.1 phospholipid/cholesterol/gamma-HCH transport system substrate-binding protein [Parabacteroides sp. PH5-13]MDH6322917.1 phospholipid/cholesterol/gamma-HCH transport system substrate-
MKKNVLTKEAKIGIITIISIGLLYFGINYLKGVNLFKPVNHYFVSFNNVKDLTISSPVYIEGFKVGLVRAIRYDYTTTDKITVEVSLEDDMRINRGSYIVIENTLLSGAALHIKLNKYVNEYLKSGETIEGRLGSDMMTDVQEKILPEVTQLLPKIDSILAGLQHIVNHPALGQSLEHIERTTNNLEVSTLQLNRLLNNDVPVIVSDLKKITGNFTEISEELKGLDLNATVSSVNQTLANLQLTTNKLNSTDSSLGLLLNDKALYNNLNATMENASTLLFDLKENPKRYVHFSLF